MSCTREFLHAVRLLDSWVWMKWTRCCAGRREVSWGDSYLPKKSVQGPPWFSGHNYFLRTNVSLVRKTILCGYKLVSARTALNTTPTITSVVYLSPVTVKYKV